MLFDGQQLNTTICGWETCIRI